MKTTFLTITLIALSIFLGHLTTVHAQAVSTWFTYSSGNNTCVVKKISQTPIKVSFVCANPYGVEQGSYTADPTNGGNGVNTFMLRFGSNDISQSSITCFIAMNSTAAPFVSTAFGTIPPNSAGYSCAGSGVGVISWP